MLAKVLEAEQQRLSAAPTAAAAAAGRSALASAFRGEKAAVLTAALAAIKQRSASLRG